MIIMLFGLTMLAPLILSYVTNDGAQSAYDEAFALTMLSGALLWYRYRKCKRDLTIRDGFLMVVLVWSVLPAFAAVPLMIHLGISHTDAYFETMSGLTTTGSTVLSNLDTMPMSINLWRHLLVWIGGMGLIVLAIAILPLLGIGGRQMFKAETPGPMKDTRLTPRIAETARGLWSVYFVFSLACMLAYRYVGMSWPDAFMHTCTTMGLGGFSSHDASFGYWNSPQVEWVAIIFMALAGVSFARYFIVWRARSMLPLLRDVEIRTYAMVLLASIAGLAGLLLAHGTYESAAAALQAAAFHVVSVATTTGYASTDYAMWPVFAPIWLMFLGTFVSCAGSTGGGIKMVRMVVLVKQARREMVRAIHPRIVNPVTLGRATISNQVIANVMAYMLIYGATTLGLTMLMLLSGLDIVTAFSAVVATVNNIGPGLGRVGPSANFGNLSDFQTWVCTVGMLVGRLELIAVMVLFTPEFWRR